jgi:hypothetical protein
MRGYGGSSGVNYGRPRASRRTASSRRGGRNSGDVRSGRAYALPEADAEAVAQAEAEAHPSARSRSRQMRAGAAKARRLLRDARRADRRSGTHALSRAWLEAARAELGLFDGDLTTYYRCVESAVAYFTSAGDMLRKRDRRPPLDPRAMLCSGGVRNQVLAMRDLEDAGEGGAFHIIEPHAGRGITFEGNGPVILQCANGGKLGVVDGHPLFIDDERRRAGGGCVIGQERERAVPFCP